jgi:nicotinate-nucleotide adenylyltransferase
MKYDNNNIKTFINEYEPLFNFKKDEAEFNIILYIKYILSLLILFIDITKIPNFILYYFLLFSNCYCYCYCIRTGIYGGSFNPIHNGHIALARQMIESGLMDEVWFMVSPLNPFKKEKSDLLSDELRLEMTRLALEGEPKMIAQDFEFHLPKPSYTWQTLQALSEVYPNRQFILIIGGDNWQLFDRWFHYQDILNNYSLVVYPREGINIDADSLPNNVKLLKAELYPISSTQVRKNIKEGKPINDLIPKTIIQKVLKYYKGN